MLIVIMGVSGSGKSTLGGALAGALGWDFQEGDDLHSSESIAKMQTGIALDDADREPWLAGIAHWMSMQSERGRSGVVSCSALRRRYRDQLRAADADVRFVYLRVSRDALERRMLQRQHFMPASLLQSQLSSLEEPELDEHVLELSGNLALDDAIRDIRACVDR
ncbi:gluconokinase, GntK/IdnK-type [Rhodanobacter sp. L36]|uniref:gluconokinase n=1 Tax=Rhodanobacter sp. L36 TaxID=1747221 RepID=UPI001C208C29|nr:gluconokinase, GntK/IdnK-type [Rhodanobacter sp. L36]